MISTSLSPSYSAADLERLIAPALRQPLAAADYGRLAKYMELLYRWNRRMNLTAVRDPGLFARVHLTECLLAGQWIPPDVDTLLDFGSGAGLPGIPMAIVCPRVTVTLAESQAKKAGFLREAVRELGLQNAEVFHGRAESLDGEFGGVALRAVDKMSQALIAARAKIRAGGSCLVLASARDRAGIEALLPDMCWLDPVLAPGSSQRVILRARSAGNR